MHRSRQYLALVIGGIGTVAALLGAPLAAADENGGGGADNPLGAGCETAGGGGSGQFTTCVSPGNAQLRAVPNDLGLQGAEVDEGAGIFGGF